ncbi:MAG: hypothetical protein R3Y12_01340 [Clostridia bacterium]
MYNDYANENFYHTQFIPSKSDDFIENESKQEQNSMFSNIFSNFNMPEINSETLILFAIIFFAIYDDFDTDLIIILGILFLLGV